MSDGPVPEITAQEAAAIAASGEGTLLDVRDLDEVAFASVSEAMHIPLADLASRRGELPLDGRVAVFCHGGGRGARAVAVLRSAGIDAVNVRGGLRAWQQSDLPMSGRLDD